MRDVKTIGILGGMGPMTTVEFFRRLIEATPARSDPEHLHILIDNDPSVPNRSDALLHRGPSPVPLLRAMARRLEAAGAQVLAIPCNTAHAFLDDVREAVTVPVVDMIDETVAAAAARLTGADGAGTAVGLLATDGTIRSCLYRDAFEARGIEAIAPSPEAQQSVTAAIEAIKAGRSLTPLERPIFDVVERLAAAGAAAAIVACTELSLLSGDRIPIRWIDALDVLVGATLREAGVDTMRGREESE